MILLPFPILAPLIVRSTEEKKRETNKEDKTNCFQKIESFSDYWHKLSLFIGAPCIKYVYYFVKILLHIYILKS